jgi:hypothetical protein
VGSFGAWDGMCLWGEKGCAGRVLPRGGDWTRGTRWLGREQACSQDVEMQCQRKEKIVTKRAPSTRRGLLNDPEFRRWQQGFVPTAGTGQDGRKGGRKDSDKASGAARQGMA